MIFVAKTSIMIEMNGMQNSKVCGLTFRLMVLDWILRPMKWQFKIWLF